MLEAPASCWPRPRAANAPGDVQAKEAELFQQIGRLPEWGAGVALKKKSQAACALPVKLRKLVDPLITLRSSITRKCECWGCTNSTL